MAITDAKFTMVSINSGISSPGAWQVYRVFNAEPVVSAGEVDSVFKNPVDSPGMELAQFSNFGFYSIIAGSAPDIEFKILQSYNNVAANFVIPDTDSSINIIVGAGTHINVVTPTAMPFIRFRASGHGSNGANTVVTAYVFLKSA